MGVWMLLVVVSSIYGALVLLAVMARRRPIVLPWRPLLG
jgi:hypothetical protein